ncbi:MAG: hypothetical protein ACKVU4_02895 [Phycisphaerales bacterium]
MTLVSAPMCRWWGLGFALCATATHAQEPGEKVLLAPKFVPGQSSRYTVEAEFTRRRAPREDAPGTIVTQAFDIRAETRTVDREGIAVVRVTFDRLRVRVERRGGAADAGDPAAGPTPTTWEWNRAAGEPVSEGPPVAGMAQANAALADAVLEVRVAPDGALRGIAGLERAYEALVARGRDAEPIPILGALSPGAAESFLEGFWCLVPGDGSPPVVAIGESWEVARSTPFPGGYEAESTAVYTLERVRTSVAEISGQVRYALRSPRIEPDPADPMPRIVEQSARAAVTWDGAAGRLVRRRVERSLAWSTTLALREPLEVRDYTTTRVTITLMPEAP